MVSQNISGPWTCNGKDRRPCLLQQCRGAFNCWRVANRRSETLTTGNIWQHIAAIDALDVRSNPAYVTSNLLTLGYIIRIERV